MKDLDKAAQANAEVARDYYGVIDYENLLNIDGVFNSPMIGEDGKPICMLVDLRKVETITVELNTYGRYCTVAEMVSGEKVIVKL